MNFVNFCAVVNCYMLGVVYRDGRVRASKIEEDF